MNATTEFTPDTPQHVAIIMDGNGRWATRRGLPRLAGHRKGVESVRDLVKAAPGLGITYLTIFAFSTENWKRAEAEVTGLMNLLRRYITKESAKLMSNNVRVRFIGGRERLDEDLQRLMLGLEERTEANDGLQLTVALNYGGRAELARAAGRVAQDVAVGKLRAEDVTEDRFAGYLDTAGLPDPDLVIRTSGENRISNFLLWQAAYSEYVFVDTCWPDFTPDDLAACLDRFRQRERRFGAVVG
ncbi:isoprenyl transferase [Oceanomicrobium pacificus]|uniref:Isoprenyl transferase n=1 Tax=Oceanomicrobium pacificus TaxID=2692916 RepID=A0A6B0TXG5_9RHOB|nr:isoprenyl transferase [Oceanomicrobium pacificus]MXU65834.1 isoprenyl transferase [Oceanomicrobium pacificus]